MTSRRILVILALFLFFTTSKGCPKGFGRKRGKCVDEDECNDLINPCGDNGNCKNTNGSFYCECDEGFRLQTNVTCKDINECLETPDICGPNAICQNTIPQYSCSCKDGFYPSAKEKTFLHDKNVTCTDICVIKKTICGNGTCYQGPSGHYCECHVGFTNYGREKSHCTEFNYDVINEMNNLNETFPNAHGLVNQLKGYYQTLAENKSLKGLGEEDLLKRLLSIIDELLSGGAFHDNRKVSNFLDLVEYILRLIGPFIDAPGANRSSTHSELAMFVHKEPVLPQGAKTLPSKQAQLDIQLETAAGDPSHYPGFTTVSLLSYLNLEDSAQFYDGMKPQENQTFQINSKVVTVTVSNRNTSLLKEPVNITLYHLTSNDTPHMCVFWDSSWNGGSWSARGCSVVESNLKYTVCSCNHLSSFAVLMALYEMEDRFELQLLTWVGLSLSLVCLFICILTFSMIRSIKSPRTTIHLHLCISLFIANLVFLSGISQTTNRVGCGVVAGLLHFFYLAAFCWMCLEGIQLFRMVVLVFNANFKTSYMLAGGYGVPAVIVAVSALVNPKGYGTKTYCWLNLESIWSFFGPACLIIIINIFFFLITVWKLAEKFSSLNPDLDKLQKIKAFVITAVAQLCILGTMWIFGCFQFQKGTIAMSYLFTILGSLQGLMLFVMHCLFSKQVRDEYRNILSRFCAPRKKSYSQFSSSLSSKAHTSKSSHDTGESHI
ncbi:adhesion G protein-coupled receptor E2 isoform X2 [Mugil cephalus]|uniref:adhesion G protein-coupled receptor E2 isoform X2 n=1 Tax=Mugil cephalus TaxID=48193 RepID=UPI001FB83A26|nr:adhesion G protein-coupled receptor E2 isoform X2 [Mugil cephalus]